MGAFTNLLLSTLLSINFTVGYHPNPEYPGEYSGTTFQLVDSKQTPLINRKFSFMRDLGHGLLLARSVNKSDPYNYGDDVFLYTHDGLEIKPALFPRAKFVSIIWFGEEAAKDPNLKMDRIPADAVIKYKVDSDEPRVQELGGYVGLCDGTGKIVGESPIQAIGQVHFDGKVLLSYYNQTRVFNCKTKHSSPTIGSLDYDPKRFSDYPVGEKIVEIGKDRFIQCKPTDNGKFDSAYWKAHHQVGVSRHAMFSRFLKENKLIGMPKSQVIELLGDGFTVDGHQPFWYQIVSGGCVSTHALLVKLSFDTDDKVSSWCFSKSGKDHAPIKENVWLHLPNPNPKGYMTDEEFYKVTKTGHTLDADLMDRR